MLYGALKVTEKASGIGHWYETNDLTFICQLRHTEQVCLSIAFLSLSGDPWNTLRTTDFLQLNIMQKRSSFYSVNLDAFTSCEISVSRLLYYLNYWKG